MEYKVGTRLKGKDTGWMATIKRVIRKKGLPPYYVVENDGHALKPLDVFGRPGLDICYTIVPKYHVGTRLRLRGVVSGKTREITGVRVDSRGRVEYTLNLGGGCLYERILDDCYTIEEDEVYRIGMTLRSSSIGAAREITGIREGKRGETFYILDGDAGKLYSVRDLNEGYTILLDADVPSLTLMTPADVRRRLDAGEDALDLSIEHWVENAAWLAVKGELPKESTKGDTCALCMLHYLSGSCRDCPLYAAQGRCCSDSLKTAYGRFLYNSIHLNAMLMVKALIACKGTTPKPELPQFYVWEEGVEPRGKVGFRLIKKHCNVRLLAVDKDGNSVNCGSILSITPDGKVHLHMGVNLDLGLQLDPNERVELTV